jgi:hypothetical protein
MTNRRPCARQQEIGPFRRQYDGVEIIGVASRDPGNGGAMLFYRLLDGGNHMGRLDSGEVGQVVIGKQGIGGGHGNSWLEREDDVLIGR